MHISWGRIWTPHEALPHSSAPQGAPCAVRMPAPGRAADRAHQQLRLWRARSGTGRAAACGGRPGIAGHGLAAHRIHCKRPTGSPAVRCHSSAPRRAACRAQTGAGLCGQPPCASSALCKQRRLQRMQGRPVRQPPQAWGGGGSCALCTPRTGAPCKFSRGRVRRRLQRHIVRPLAPALGRRTLLWVREFASARSTTGRTNRRPSARGASPALGGSAAAASRSRASASIRHSCARLGVTCARPRRVAARRAPTFAIRGSRKRCQGRPGRCRTQRGGARRARARDRTWRQGRQSALHNSSAARSVRRPARARYGGAGSFRVGCTPARPPGPRPGPPPACAHRPRARQPRSRPPVRCLRAEGPPQGRVPGRTRALESAHCAQPSPGRACTWGRRALRDAPGAQLHGHRPTSGKGARRPRGPAACSGRVRGA